MTEKEKKILETKTLFYKTKNDITKTPENWQAFLKTGSRTYKYTLRDQILIHGQNPDVTACASFEIWSKTLNRGLKKGANGIALLHNDKDGELRIDYVHDVSNTEEKSNSKSGFLWDMKQDYHQAISQSMTARFGEASSPFLENNLMEWCAEAVHDYIPSMLENLNNNIEGSLLEELDPENLELCFRRAVTSSVQFSVLSRCGFDPYELLDNDDFLDVYQFNTNAVFSILGNTLIDINTDILNQISDVTRSVEKGEYSKTQKEKIENVLDNEEETVYDIIEEIESIPENTVFKEDKEHEREFDSELNGGIHSRVRPTSTEMERGGFGERTTGNVGGTSADILEEAQELVVSVHGLEHDTDGTRFPSGQRSRQNGRYADNTDDETRGSDGGSEASRPSSVGEIVQQHQGESKRNRDERPDLRLNNEEIEVNPTQFTLFSPENDGNLSIASEEVYSFTEKVELTPENMVTGAEEQVSSAPNSVSSEKTKERFTIFEDFEKVLAHGTGETGSKERIADFFDNSDHSRKEKAEFLKNEYGNQRLMVGEFFLRTHESRGMTVNIPEVSMPKLLPYHKIVELIEGMIERGEYLTEEPQEPDLITENPEERNTILYSEASEVGKNKVENGIEEDYEIPLFRNEDGKEYAFGFGGLGNGTTVWNYLEQGDDDYKIVGHIATNGALNLRDGTLPQEAVDFLEEKADSFYPIVEVLVEEEPELTQGEKSEPTAPESPEVLFFEDFDDINLDYTLYQDGDLIGYDSNAVKYELGEIDGHYFTTTTTAITPDGQVLGHAMSQENYEKFKAWKEELAQEKEAIAEVTPEVATIEKSPETLFWEQYKELQAENPNDLVLFKNKAFYEILGDKTKELPEELHDKILYRDCNGEQIPFFSFIEHQILDYVEYFNDSGFDITKIDVRADKEEFVERILAKKDGMEDDKEISPKTELEKEMNPELALSERIPVGLEVQIDNANLIVESVDETSGYVIFNDQDKMDMVLKTQIEIPRVLEHLDLLEQIEMEQAYETPLSPSSTSVPPAMPDFPYNIGDFVDFGEDLKYSILSIDENDVLLRNHQVMMGDNTISLTKEKFLEMIEKQQERKELTAHTQGPATKVVLPTKEEGQEEKTTKTEKSTSESLFEAFQYSSVDGWQDNEQKQNIMKWGFNDILHDSDLTYDVFELVHELEPQNQQEFDRIYQVIVENLGKEVNTEQVSNEFSKFQVVELHGKNYRVNKLDGDEVHLNNSISRLPLILTRDELQGRLQQQIDIQARKERNLQDLLKIPVEKVTESQPKEQIPPTTAESTSKTDTTEQKGENFKITNPELGHGTAKEKFHRNILAIQTLQQIESEKRSATPEEQEILSNYVGWGGLQEAFDDSKPTWASEYETLKDLLPEKEYAQAKRSVLDSFYTAPEIIESMYEALEKMGVPQNSKILEPSLGVGNFIGMKSEYFSESLVQGTELDSISGRIAKLLYPEADIQIKGFEKSNFADESFDVAIGNVPFGDFSVNDPKYKNDNLKIHDYFFAKTLDQVKKGGIIAYITSSGTMDKKTSTFREKLSEKADLLGAIRLPNTAFKQNAGTEVTSDIIFLQKRSKPPEKSPEWVSQGENHDNIAMNQYFIDNPDMIMGNMAMVSGPYGATSTCIPDTETTLKEQLSKAIKKLKTPIKELLVKLAVVENENNNGKGKQIFGLDVPENARNFSYFLKDNTIYFKDNDNIFKPVIKKAHEPRIKDMIALADQTRKVIDLQLDQCSDEVLEKEQAILNKLHDDYHQKNGVFAQRGNKMAFKDDISYPLLCSLQNLDDDKKLVGKADIFTKRTIRQTSKVTKVNTPVEALGVCIGEKGKIDITFMEQLLQGKMDSKDIIKSLEGIIFKNPFSDMKDPLNGWENADEYLSGNVREKLVIAEKMLEVYPELAINVKKLKEVQPTHLKANEIDVRIGSTWIDPKFYKQFMFEMLNTPLYLQNGAIDIFFDKNSNEWNIRGQSVHKNGAMLDKYGTKRRNPYQLLEDCLNLRDTKVNDRIDGTYVLNPVETAKAREKQEAIGEKFVDWIWKDPERRAELESTYNEIYNSIRPREFDGSHIQFDGMTDQIELKPHQKNAVARSLYGENTLLAHCVGAGKSFTMIAAAMEGKRLGIHKKSMLAVPKHLVVQMGADVSKLYPSASVLVATEDDFTPAKREEFCSRVATGDFDLVILGHTQFTALQFSPEKEEQLLNKQIDEFTKNILEAKGENSAVYTVKRLEKAREKAKIKLEKLKSAEKPTVESIYFDKMGIDKLFVDEAHLFKNLIVHSKMQNVVGVASGDSARALDMLAKCQYINEVSNGKGIVFATGTPISNSMSELFVMMKFLQENTLKKLGLNHFDSWASSFGEKVTSLELAPEGVRYKGGQELV